MPMQLRRHPSARCLRCGRTLWFGLKREGSGWKVVSQCERANCRREELVAYIPMHSVASEDEAYERAEKAVQCR